MYIQRTLVISRSYLEANNPLIFILPQELNKVSVQLDQVTAKLNDKQEYCAQLEANLKDYKEQHLYLEQKTEELEGQLKVCIERSVWAYLRLMFTAAWWYLIKGVLRLQGRIYMKYDFCRYSFSLCSLIYILIIFSSSGLAYHTEVPYAATFL